MNWDVIIGMVGGIMGWELGNFLWPFVIGG